MVYKSPLEKYYELNETETIVNGGETVIPVACIIKEALVQQDHAQHKDGLGVKSEKEIFLLNEILIETLWISNGFKVALKSRESLSVSRQTSVSKQTELVDVTWDISAKYLQQTIRFDSNLFNSIQIIKETELLSRGYKFGYCNPIQRLENSSRIRTCIEIRRILFQTTNWILNRIVKEEEKLGDLNDINLDDNQVLFDFEDLNIAPLRLEIDENLDDCEFGQDDELKLSNLNTRILLFKKAKINIFYLTLTQLNPTNSISIQIDQILEKLTLYFLTASDRIEKGLDIYKEILARSHSVIIETASMPLKYISDIFELHALALLNAESSKKDKSREKLVAGIKVVYEKVQNLERELNGILKELDGDNETKSNPNQNHFIDQDLDTHKVEYSCGEGVPADINTQTFIDECPLVYISSPSSSPPPEFKPRSTLSRKQRIELQRKLEKEDKAEIPKIDFLNELKVVLEKR